MTLVRLKTLLQSGLALILLLDFGEVRVNLAEHIGFRIMNLSRWPLWILLYVEQTLYTFRNPSVYILMSPHLRINLL